MDFQLCLKDIEESQRRKAENFVCAICKNICHKCLVGICQHIFCRKCAKLFLSKQSAPSRQFSCPIDNMILKENELFKGQYLDEHISKFHCHCTNRGLGCGWQGTIKEYYTVHHHECFFIKNYYNSVKEDNIIVLDDDFANECSNIEQMREVIIIE